MNNNNEGLVLDAEETKTALHDEWRSFNTIVFVIAVVAVYWFLVIRPRLPGGRRQKTIEDDE